MICENCDQFPCICKANFLEGPLLDPLTTIKNEVLKAIRANSGHNSSMYAILVNSDKKNVRVAIRSLKKDGLIARHGVGYIPVIVHKKQPTDLLNTELRVSDDKSSLQETTRLISQSTNDLKSVIEELCKPVCDAAKNYIVINHRYKTTGPCWFENCTNNADMIIEDPNKENTFGFKPTRFYVCEPDLLDVLYGKKSLKKESDSDNQ